MLSSSFVVVVVVVVLVVVVLVVVVVVVVVVLVVVVVVVVDAAAACTAQDLSYFECCEVARRARVRIVDDVMAYLKDQVLCTCVSLGIS